MLVQSPGQGTKIVTSQMARHSQNIEKFFLKVPWFGDAANRILLVVKVLLQELPRFVKNSSIINIVVYITNLKTSKQLSRTS